MLNENNKDGYVLDGYEVCHIVRETEKVEEWLYI